MRFARTFVTPLVIVGLTLPAAAASSFLHPLDTNRPSAGGLPLEMVTWSSGEDSGGHYVRNAQTKIYVESAKKADRIAKRFNKIEKKEGGLKAEDDGPCGPLEGGIGDGPVDRC